jgi:hypothetical protein
MAWRPSPRGHGRVANQGTGHKVRRSKRGRQLSECLRARILVKHPLTIQTNALEHGRFYSVGKRYCRASYG